MTFPVEANEDRLIISPIKGPDMTEGGLHIPDVAKAPPSKGIVRAVGPGNACKHCSLPKQNPPNIGDIVIFPATAGYDYDFEFTEEEAAQAGDSRGTVYKIIRFSDVMTIKRNAAS